MKRAIVKAVVVVVALLVGWLIWGIAKPNSYANLPPTATGGWVAFGDSLTHGTGAGEGQSYPDVLSQSLGFPILNHGVPGDTTGSALARLPAILELKPKVVLLCLGGNDALQRLPMNQTFANLGSIIDQLQNAGSFVVLIGVRGGLVRNHYEDAFEKLADEKHVLLVPDILDDVLLSSDLMSDYVHPNEKGYQVIAARIEKLLQPVMKELQ